MYREIVEPTFVWENFSIEDQNNILASKRSNNCLDTKILELDHNNNIKPIKEAVRDILNKMKENMTKI